jgi:exodeoxyribonuclease VII large subunit
VTARRSPARDGGGDFDLFAASHTLAEPAPAARTNDAPLIDDGYPGETPQLAIAVSTLTQTAKDVLEGAFLPLWVRGEISDFKAHRNGHWYFCLRDSTSQIRSVVWKREQRGIPAAPDDGMQVAAFGRLSVYAARGEMQFTVTRIEAEGDGLRRKALEITRARLEADGLLSLERKRALPRFPRVIAVVTSPDGAALHDIVAVIRRRRADVRVIVVPAAVQGETAPEELCFALDQVNRWGGADLVIVGRGGGSREDLWAFNDERVARAVAACHAPTISAVGHEVDISICDLVADYRAPTPSAAAEAATRSADELNAELREWSSRMGAAARAVVRMRRDHVRHLGRDLADAATGQLATRQATLQSVAGRLHTLSPVATLARGYSVARGRDGATLSSVQAFQPNGLFDLVVRDGIVPARVDGVPQRSAS